MFVRVTKVKRKNRVYEYAQLVESYRDAKTGKPRHRVLANLGRLAPDVVEALRAAFRAARDEAPIIVAKSPDDPPFPKPKKPDANLAYLDLAVGMEIWNYWGLESLVDDLMPATDRKMSAAEVVRALTLQRLVAPDSKLKAIRWFPKTVLAVTGSGQAPFNNSRVHRVLDELEAVTPALQARLTQRYQQRDGAFVSLFTDVTDTWFVGHGPEGARVGKTKEGRIQRKIGIALMCNENGYPVRWNVLRGNEADGPAMLELLQQVSGLAWAADAPIVLDRAMGTSSAVRAMKRTRLRFLTALRRTEFDTYAPDLPWQSVQPLEWTGDNTKELVEQATSLVEAAGMQAVDDKTLIKDLGVVAVDRSCLGDESQDDDSPPRGPNARALHIARQAVQNIEEGRHQSLAKAAAALGVTRTALSKYKTLLGLDEQLQQRILGGEAEGYALAALLRIARLESYEQQRHEFSALLEQPISRRASTLPAATTQGSPPTPPDDSEPLQVRVVGFFNPERFAEQRKIALERRRRVRQFVADLNQKLARSRRRRKPTSILAEVDRRLRRDDALTLYDVELLQRQDGGHEVRLSLCQQEYERRSRYHGFSVLVAHPELQQDAAELCRLYRVKDTVEKDFQTIKSAVELRPIRHRTDLKVSAHVTLCMLALLLERTLYNRLGDTQSAQQALEILKPCHLNRFESTTGTAAYTVTKPDREQRAILRKLRLQKLADDRWLYEHLTPA